MRLVPTLGILASTMSIMPAAHAGNYDDPFTDDSYWTTPLPASAERHPNSNAIIDFLANDNGLGGCVTLSGYPGNSWGMPIYRTDSGDPVLSVDSPHDLPFDSLHFPAEAFIADNDDGEVVVYDEEQNIVVELFRATIQDGSLKVSGGSGAHLDSNGIDRRADGGDPRNFGTYRGYNGAVATVHYDDVADGRVERVHKISINNSHEGHIWPFVNSDGKTDNPAAPLQGTRLRIKPGVNLEAKGLFGQALIIARGLQEYGMVVGDNSGGDIVLKLEDTVGSGRGQLWQGLDRQSLCSISIHDFEVVAAADPPPTEIGGFTDIVNSIFVNDIMAIAEEGITKGCNPPTNDRFCPDDFVTRGQMAAFLHRALGDLLEPSGSGGFVDIAGSTFVSDIEWLGATGVTKGCNPPANDRFCPNDFVTRGQMAAFLVRSLGYTDNGGGDLFVDDNGNTFENDIDKLGTAGVTRGCNPPVNDRFCPNNLVTRGQTAAFLNRAFLSD